MSKRLMTRCGRNGLWLRLWSCGIKGKMWRVVHNLSPYFRHNCLKEAFWIEHLLNPLWGKAKATGMIQGQARSGDGPAHGRRTESRQTRAADEYDYHPQSALLEASKEGVNNNCSHTRGDVRTLCKAGRLKDVLHILNQGDMQVDANTYICVLQECTAMKGLREGKQVHAHITRSGIKPNIFLLNTLVNMYAKCGSVEDARQVFDKMTERDIYTWNIILGGYAKHGGGREAFEMYEQMQGGGVTPDRVTFICILNACASLGAQSKGKEVHADIIKARIGLDIILETAIAAMYAKCGSLRDARIVFDSMAHRNVISWNVMITGYSQHGCGREALGIYEQMIQEGMKPNKVTFICVLHACASLGALEKGKEVHADIIKAGIASYINLENALVTMYAKCGSVVDAQQVFDRMTQRNTVSWNALIAGYAQHGYGREALESYEQMIRDGGIPDKFTFTCVLNVCASLASLEKGQKVHAYIIKAGIVSDIILETALVNMYAKCRNMKNALQVFDKMADRDVVSWSAMIAGYVQHGCGMEAFLIYEQMIREGVTPNRVTFICALNACANLAALKKGKEVHANIIEAGIASSINLENALVSMYLKCGSMKNARQVFDHMAERDVVSWSSMITGYAQHESGRGALETYEQMIQEGVTPDIVTFTCVLNACASLAALGRGKKVHADIVKAGIPSDIILESALAAMYAKCGDMKDARQVFDNMAVRDVVSWSVIIAGYAQHGCAVEALQLFEQMPKECLKPDSITYLCVLSACSYVGLVDEGYHYFDSMSRDHGLTPAVEHFGCMVDLLGRAGRLGEAEDFINKMPTEPDASVLGALLGACRIHGNVEVAERAAQHLLKRDSQDAATYVLLSNIYAAAGRWDDTAKVRRMMQDRGFRKEPGCSLIEVDNQVHTFIVDDKLHRQNDEIHAAELVVWGDECGWVYAA